MIQRYMVMAVQKTVDIAHSEYGFIQTVLLCCSNGMVGMIPVFDTKENAERYADNSLEVMEITTESETLKEENA